MVMILNTTKKILKLENDLSHSIKKRVELKKNPNCVYNWKNKIKKLDKDIKSIEKKIKRSRKKC